MRQGLFARFGAAVAIAAIVSSSVNAAAPVRHIVGATVTRHVGITTSSQPSDTLPLTLGRGQLITLSQPMSDVFVAEPTVADVQVRSPTQLYIFGKGAGETTIYATNKAGGVVYSTNVRVGTNLTNISQMLKLAMPEAAITATPMNGLILLTGTVATPADVEQAQSLVQAFAGKDTKIISRLKTATPMQVSLHVKIAEVNREFSKQIGINLLNRDTTGGFLFGIAQGRNFGTIGTQDLSSLPKLDASSLFNLPSGSISLPFNAATGQFITSPGTAYNLSNLGVSGKTAIALAGHVLGMDLATAIDLAESDGLVSTLAEPNLTALSGETASFLAGGEIPVPISTQLGQIQVDFKAYGVQLAFTPTVLADGRISLRVRPEVSQLTSTGAVTLNTFTIPGISTRRAETTVELGSGQSFMIGGLLSNTHNNTIDKAPFLGDLPVLGALFRSNSFKRSETELVIMVTPYLVKPTNASDISLPTDGYKGSTDFQRIIEGQSFSGKTGQKRPHPTSSETSGNQPTIGALAPLQTPASPPASKVAGAPVATAPKEASSGSGDGSASTAAPGFSFN